METKTEGVSDAKANKFWGAIKIFTEKPHVINRRICGVINLWIGICEEKKNYDLKKVLTSVLDATESDEGTQKESEVKAQKDENSFDKSSSGADNENVDASKCDVQESSQETITENNINFKADKNSKTDEKLPLNKKTTTALNSLLQWDTTNQENSGIECEDTERSGKFDADITHMNLSLIQKKLEDCCFKSLSEHDLSVLQDGCETSENDNSNAKNCNVGATTKSDLATNLQDEIFHDESDDDDEGETLSKNHHQNPSSDSQKGRLTIPWEYLSKTSDTIAVIRQILPKQANKFTSALEVVLLGM